MQDLKNTKAPVSTKTLNRNEFDQKTDNIYEAISITAKRAIQINSEIKKELLEKLEEFATYSDSLE
ncbi:MAG: DNA-directed RNA polymerase subunit omega, partial [Bacteroidota bacterium]